MIPFEGLRVVELGDAQCVAQAGQFLADFGAEVIMVEPRGGSPLRGQAAFPFWARGKRSVVLDLDSPADVAELRKLIAGADVLLESCRPGELERLGLTYEQLAGENPGLVHGSITAFGKDSPYASLPLDEQVVQAVSGMFKIFRRMSSHPDRPPYVSVPFATHAATHAVLHGILAALHERTRSGLGQLVETNLVLAFLTLDSWMWFEHSIAKKFPDAVNPAPNFDAQGRPQHHLTMRLLVAPTKDGHWMQFAATAQRLFIAKLKGLGLGWMLEDPEWAGIPMFSDPDKFMDLWTRMINALRGRTLAEWQTSFEADPDLFAEQFRTCSTLLDHPQLLHDGFTITLDDPERGPVRQPGALIRAAKTPAVFRPAPRLDADRAAVLGQGWSRPALPRPAPAGQAPRGLSLEGVTIVEFCSMFAAPGGPAMLVEFGARVIKVEPPEGDPIRNISGLPEVAGIRPMLGKDSICIDLTKEEGRQLARDLCRDADVVIQSYRAGAIERLGLDYKSIKAINPDIVYINASGYGTDGPYGHRPAYAPSIGAAAAFSTTNMGMSGATPPDMTLAEVQDIARRLGGAGTADMAQADGVACNVAATAIMLGLLARDFGCGGQELWTSMLNSGSHMMSGFTVTWPGAPAPAMVDTALTGTSALSRIYPGADGSVLVKITDEAGWTALVEALGDSTLAADARFATAQDRAANDAALQAELTRVLATRPAAEWEREGIARGIGLVEAINQPSQVRFLDTDFGDVHHLKVDVVDPTWGELPRQAPHVVFSRSAVQAKPAVTAGQQTDEVLTRAGMADRIEQLRADGVVA